MKSSIYPKEFLKLIEFLQKLPGVGKKTAERYAFEILTWRLTDLSNLSHLLKDLHSHLFTCSHCHFLTSHDNCSTTCCKLNGKDARDSSSLCIVASVKDAYAIEQSGCFFGIYYILQGLISPLEGRDLETINLEEIDLRIQNHNTKEVILALDSTLEGDATSLFLKHHLEANGLLVTRLALGMPVGSSLDYLDGGTLLRAFAGRTNY